MNIKTMNSEMKTRNEQTLCVCGCCKCALPIEAYYVNKKTGRPSNYCKECRKSASRKHRTVEKQTSVSREREPYPVITDTKDPETRIAMILSALQVVADSIERKKRKLSELEEASDE